MANNQIRFGVGFDVDKKSLDDLRSSLEQIQRMTKTDFLKMNPGTSDKKVIEELTKIKSTAEDVDLALKRAFNQKLNTVNLTAFQKELSKTNLSVKDIHEQFSKAGTAGQIGFQRLATTLLTTNKELKQTKTILDNMAETLSNTVKWNIASGAVNKLTGSVQQAVGYVKALDNSLNDIMIVTGKSADEMDRFAKQANHASKSLGKATVDYTDAALTFYQQGLSDTEVEARANLTLKVANASGLDAETSAEYVTSVLNGYKVAAEGAEAAMDILARVGADTASGLDELAEGMSKVASTANAMGVSEEQLAATLATVISTTRQNAATVGTAFKTIYARISDIEAGTAEAEVSLGDYTGAMAEMGFNVLDSTGHLRDLGEVVEEIGAGWKDMTREQQISLAQTMAGTRQYNNLIALFDNWDDYVTTLEGANNATGTLQEQQDTYMESTAAHLNQLKASAEDVFDSLLDADTINEFSDIMSGVLGFTANWIDALGGGGETLLALGSIGANVFSNQIAKGLQTVINNFNAARYQLENFKAESAQIKEIQDALGGTTGTGANAALQSFGDEKIQEIVALKKQALAYGNIMTDAQSKEANGYIESIAKLKEQEFELAANQTTAQEFLHTIQQMAPSVRNIDFNDEDIENFNYQVEKARSEIQELVQSTQIPDNLFRGLREAASDADALSADIGGARESFFSMTQAIRTTESVLGKTSPTFNVFRDAMSALGKAINQETVNPEEVRKRLSAVQAAYAKAQQDIQGKVSATYQAMNDKSEGTKTKILNDIKVQETAYNQFLDALRSTAAIQGLTKLVAGFGQLTSALMTLSNIKKTLENPDLSTGEKILQITQQLTFAIPMLVSGFVSMSTGMSSFVAGFPALVAGLTGGKVAATTFGVALKGLLAEALIPILTIVGPIVAAIAAFAAIAYVAAKAYNADAEAAKEAAKEVETLTQRYNELTSAVEEFKEASSSYEESVKALEELDKGTEEYAEALEKANNQARDLIEKYKLFGQYSTDASTGLITFDEGALEEIGRQKEAAANEMKQNLYGAKIVSNQANLTSQTTDLGRDIGSQIKYQYDDGYGNMIDGFRNFTNGELQEAAEALGKIGDISLKSEEEIAAALESMDELSPAMKENIDAIVDNRDKILDLTDSMNEATKANEYYVKQIMGIAIGDKYGKDIKAMATGADGKTDAALETAITDAITSVAVREQESGDKGMAAEIAAIDVSKASSNSALNKILKGIEGYSEVGNDEDLARLYAEKVLGLDPDTLDYKGGLNKGTLKDETGKKVVDEVSDDVMRHALAKQAQIDEITKKYTENIETNSDAFVKAVGDMVAKTTDSAGQLGADFSQALLQAISNGEDGKIDLASMFGEISPEEYNKLMGMTPEELSTAMGITPEILSSLGLEDSQAFAEAFKNGLDSYSKEDYYHNELTKADNIDSLNTVMTEAAFNGANIDYTKYADQLQVLAEQYENAATEAEKYANVVNQLKTAGLDEGSIEDNPQVQAAQAALEIAIRAGEAAEKYDLEVEQVESQAKRLAEEFESTGDSASDAARKASALAVANQRLNRGIGNLYDNLEDYTKILKNSDKYSTEYCETMDSMKDIMADVFNVASGDMLSDSFIQKLIDDGVDLQAIADGDVEAIDRIRMAVADDIVATIVADIVDENAAAEVNSLWADAQARLAELGDLTVGTHIEGTDEFVTALNGMIESAGMTKEQVTSLLGSMGMSAELHTEYKKQEMQVPTYTEVVEPSAEVQIADGAGGYIPVQGYRRYTVPGEPVTVEGFAEVVSIETSADGASSGGGIDFIGSGKPSYSNTSAGRQSLGSGKRGGGGSKTPKKKDVKKDKKDPFHDIDIQIKNITRDLEELQTVQERLTGKELIDNLNEQLRILDAQKAAMQDKIELARMESGTYRRTLENAGARFGADGQITNYAEFMNSALNDLNAAIGHFNSLSAEAQDDAAEAAVEAAEERYEELKEALEQYESLLNDTIPDLEEQIEGVLLKQIEIQITKFNMKVDIELELTDAAKQWNEFKKNVIERDNKHTVTLVDDKGNPLKDSNGDVITRQVRFEIEADANQNKDDYLAVGSSILENTKHVNDLNEIITAMEAGGHSSIYSSYDEETGTWVDNIAAAYEDLEKYRTQLMDDLQTLEELEDAVEEQFLNSIDAVANAYSEQAEVYDFLNSQIEHNLQLTELLYGEEAYDKMEEYYKSQTKSSEAQVDRLQKQADYWKDLMDKAREAGDDAAYEKYKSNWMDSINELNTAIETWAENITAEYENTVKKIMKELNNAVSGGLGLSYIGEELDLLNSNAENYLDTINSAYALQKLENQWQTAIDSTDGVAAQRELNELMEKQMEMLREKGQLTQYDIDRAELEYQIALKQIALKESQQNKSTMRLKRDANGNYSYQFVSDSDAVANAQQELASAQNELYNFDKGAYQENLNEIYAVWEEFQQKITDAMLDTSLSDEERQQKIALLHEQYGEKVNFLTEQNLNIREGLQNSAFTNLAEMYNTDVSYFQQMSDDEKDILMQQIVPQWDSGVQTMTDKFAGEGGFEEVCETAFSDLKIAADEYIYKLEEVGMANQEVTDAVYLEQEALQNGADLAVDAAQREMEAVQSVRDEVQGLAEDYRVAKYEAIAASEAAYALWQQKQREQQSAASSGSGGGSSSSGGGSSSSSGGSSSSSAASGRSSSGGDGQLNVGDTVTYVGGKYYSDSYGNGPSGSRGPGKKVTVTKIHSDGRPYPIHVQSSDSAYGWLKKEQLTGYDTGGYTGNWEGQDGKIALLHQKEIVLNRTDTENLLKAVDILRSIVSAMEQNVLTNALSAINSLKSYSGPMPSDAQTETLEQNVHIEASFPNVVQSNEIQDAFNNLINIAAQRAGRNTR